MDIILKIMEEINQRINNLENQKELLTTELEKCAWNNQKIAYKESLSIVAKYLNK